MNWYEALVFGLVQGLTEFLPVSSSGHLEMVKYFFGGVGENLLFSVVVHGATILSILVVFWKEISKLISDVLKFTLNEGTDYALKILLSMVPIAIVGLTAKSFVEGLFTANMILTGSMLLITAFFLALSHFIKKGNKKITYTGAFIMGLAQAIAVLPGLSRSGLTISAGLMAGHRKEELTRFSFLMVIFPVIGANLVEIFSIGIDLNDAVAGSLLIAFVAAFVSGYVACKWMIKIVNRGKLIWFALYCMLVGLSLLVFA